MLRYLTAGESHGQAEVSILEGIPAGLSLAVTDIQMELEKRRGGTGRGGRGKIETDEVKILSGVRFGKTLGSPIALFIENKDFANWERKMRSYHDSENTEEENKVTTARPGHADLAGSLKYHFDDIRNVLERASARETVMRVAVGAICKKLLFEFGIAIASHTIQIGSVRLAGEERDFSLLANVYNTDPEIRCIDKGTSDKMKDAILTATRKKDTLGGVVEIIARGVPPGLGSYVHFDRKLDGVLAQALMSIPSVKAVEIGDGVANASYPGSTVHDEIFCKDNHFVRKTNRAGGVEGGVTNGEPIICRVYHKPISTLGNPLWTVDIKTKRPAKALIERSDICVVPRAGSVAEAGVAYVLAHALLSKCGGDSLSELKRNFEGYIENLTTFSV